MILVERIFEVRPMAGLRQTAGPDRWDRDKIRLLQHIGNVLMAMQPQANVSLSRDLDEFGEIEKTVIASLRLAFRSGDGIMGDQDS